MAHVEALANATDDLALAKTEMMNLMLAGGETVSTSLNEMIWLLARNKHVWQKLRAEVQQAFNGEKPELAAVKRLEYPNCIIKESECQGGR